MVPYSTHSPLATVGPSTLAMVDQLSTYAYITYIDVNTIILSTCAEHTRVLPNVTLYNEYKMLLKIEGKTA